MRLYLESGYADQKNIIENGSTFIFEVGARGTGKTYGMMKYILDNQIRFLYLRRQQNEADLVKTDLLNPFKAINNDYGLDVHAGRGQKIFPFIMDNEVIGMGAALATFYNVRGVDFSDIDLIFYDEFIPEKSARPIKEEFEAFSNMVETVNRNRELIGKEPVKVVCCANSNKLDNPIFMELQLVNRAAKMMEKEVEEYHNKDRHLSLVMFMKSPISEKKKETALYKLTAGTDFQRMAIYNMFDYDNDNIRPSKIREYTPVVMIGELCVYKHKHRKEYYVNCKSFGTFPRIFTTSDADRKRFFIKMIYLYDAYIENRVFFEDAVSLYLFEKYFE